MARRLSVTAPNVALGALLAAVFVAAALVQGDGAMNVDNRTYLEMIDGVARHGLPYLDNGPVARFPELRARWNTLHGGRLWGALPPVFPYFAAPFYALGGARLVIRLNVALLALLAWGTARLGREVSRDPWVGVGAAYLTVAGSAVWGSSLDVSPYGLALALTVWSAAFAWRALDTDGVPSRRAAFIAGLLGALAVGTHLLSAPILAAYVLAFAALPGDPGAWPGSLRAWASSRWSDGLARARVAAALAGAAGPTLLLALLNRARLGTFNPVSYGACVWRSCHETGLDAQGLGAMLRWFSPLFAWAALTALALWALRRSLSASLAAALTALAALAIPGDLRERAVATALVAFGFVVNVSPLPLAFNFVRHPDGLGLFLGPYVVRALVPMAPFTPLALLAPTSTPRERRAVVAVALPCLALLAALLLRANLPLAYALSYPFISVRYVLPAVPLLAVLAAWSARRAGFDRAAAIASLLGGAALAAALWRGPHDDPHWRRELLLRAPLWGSALAVALTLHALRSGRPAPRAAAQASMALVAALALGDALGSDLPHLLDTRRGHQQRLARIMPLLPQRFAIYGFPGELDPIISMRRGRDIEYADLYETRDWRFFPLIERWWAAGRPVFVVHHGGDEVGSPWPGARYEPVDRALGVWRVVPR